MTKNEKKQIVKKRLWSNGYKVRDMGHVYRKEPFDLLVEGRLKVVFDTAPQNKKQVSVSVDSDESITYTYYKPNGALSHTNSHIVAFGRPESRSN